MCVQQLCSATITRHINKYASEPFSVFPAKLVLINEFYYRFNRRDREAELPIEKK
jgi:hypothetical protein